MNLRWAGQKGEGKIGDCGSQRSQRPQRRESWIRNDQFYYAAEVRMEKKPSDVDCGKTWWPRQFDHLFNTNI